MFWIISQNVFIPSCLGSKIFNYPVCERIIIILLNGNIVYVLLKFYTLQHFDTWTTFKTLKYYSKSKHSFSQEQEHMKFLCNLAVKKSFKNRIWNNAVLLFIWANIFWILCHWLLARSSKNRCSLKEHVFLLVHSKALKCQQLQVRNWISF